MRGRLNKKQIKMLLDEKPLTYGKMMFLLPTGESESRTLLETFIQNSLLQANFDVFIDIDEMKVSIERKKE